MALKSLGILKLETEKKYIFIVWKTYQRRVDAFEKRLNILPIYLHCAWEERSALHKLLSYLVKSFITLRILIKLRPKVFFIQAPPVFPIYAACIYSLLFHARYIVDAHNPIIYGSFWSRMPFLSLILRKSYCVIVHNRFVEEKVKAFQTEYSVLMDVPFLNIPASNCFPNFLKKNDLPNVVVPCSFDRDEPLDEFQKAFSVAKSRIN